MLKHACVLLSLLASPLVMAQGQPPNVGTATVRVSEHTWMVPGWPNIGIVVGTQGVLVIDTGLGPRNGATAAKIAAGLAPGRKMYLTTTHYHPEHAGGEAGFPAGTVILRDAVQQREFDEHGQEFIERFKERDPAWKALLADAKFRRPDVLFDKEHVLDLGGGVKARLLWFGSAHTRGDELVLAEPDGTLFSGDVVQNKMIPSIPPPGGIPAEWLKVLSQVRALKILKVVPDHSAVGGPELVQEESAFIGELRDEALKLKKKGVGADEAGTRLTAAFKQRYPGWPIDSVSGFVKSVYTE